jgi:hypothetical protein
MIWIGLGIAIAGLFIGYGIELLGKYICAGLESKVMGEFK